MDIIPILPAPQQGTTPQPAELPTGTGGTGFDEILRQGMVTTASRLRSPDNTTIPAGRNKPEQSDPETQPAITGFDPSQTPGPALSEIDKDLTSPAESLRSPALLQPAASSLQQFFVPNAPGFIFNHAPAEFSMVFAGKISDSLPGSGTLSPDVTAPLPNVDQAVQPAEQNRSSIFARLSAQGTDFLQPAASEPNQRSAEPARNTGISRSITLELQANASPFSVKTAESVAVTAEKISIEADFTAARQVLNLAHQRLNTFAPQAPDSAKPGAVFLQSDGSSFVRNNMPIETGSFFFESSTLSFSLPGQAESAPAQTAASMQQSTLMLNQLAKLIGHNNDRLTITATLERTPNPNLTNHETLLKAVQETSDLVQKNPEQQRTAAENLFRINSNPFPAAALTIQETAPQTKPEHLRSTMMEGFREQFLGPRAASAEQNARSAADQQMQQHPQSADGSSQQHQSDTAAARSALSADQATPNSIFSSQFHDAGSAQSAETAKMVSPASAHLYQVRDQEIIKQIVDRFSLFSRQQTSRLSLQLHPAELGKLKIDLIVRGDVLKANIYTQTQQAGEIIDRNLTRLREILQDQGITVDELAVSFKSDSKDDFTPQHGQLFEDQSPLFKGQQRTGSAATFAQTIEDTLLTDTAEPSGVNLTI